MATSAPDQIRSALSDEAGAGGQGRIGTNKLVKSDNFNQTWRSLFGWGAKLTVPTLLHSSVTKPVLRTRMLLHPFLGAKHYANRVLRLL